MQASINELVAAGCVKCVEEVPYVCSPLSVVENAVSKKILVLNLWYLSKHLWKQRFKYEDLRTAMIYFNPGAYLFAFDLKSGYHHVHVGIAEVHHKFLGFQWNEAYYMFHLGFPQHTTFLPSWLGLWSATGARGIRITVYLEYQARPVDHNALTKTVKGYMTRLEKLDITPTTP